MFKKGDYVIGNRDANRYGITRHGWIGVVTEDQKGDNIDVYNKANGHFAVVASRFDKIEQSLDFESSDTRILNHKDYQWRKAIYLFEYNRFIYDDMSAVQMRDLIAIENDPRGKYVKCANCGVIVENTDEAKSAHANEYKTTAKCQTCDRLVKSRIEEKTIATDTISEDEFEVTQKSTYKMYCRHNMRNNLLADAKDSHCKYMLCNKFETLGGIHSKYPGLFNKLATSANLTEDKWTFKENDGVKYCYKARKRFTLYAYVNKMGFIHYFKLKHDDSYFEIMYSKKYDKLFAWNDFKDDWELLEEHIPEATYENVRAFIANIYKET